MDSEVDADIKTLTIGASASVSGSNTGDQNLADTVAEITDLDNDAATLSLPASTTISAFGATIIDDADASAARTTIGVDAAGTDNSTPATVGDTATLDLTIVGQLITGAVLGAPWSGITGTPTTLAGYGITDAAADNHDHAGVYEPAGVAAADITDSTVAGRTLLTAVDAAAQRTALNVEDGADVTDTANVTAAGALMDSEVDADIKTLTIGASASVSGANTGDQTLIWFRERTISEPAGTDDFLWFKAPAALTLTSFDCVAEGTTPSITVDLHECDSAGATCATVLTGTITANGGNDAGTLSDTAVDDNDWMKLLLGAPSGTVDAISCTLAGTL
jgi:hypothetical protein